VAHVTPDELDRMRSQVLEVMAQYVRLDPASRTTGARPVRIMLDLFPWFGPEEVQARRAGLMTARWRTLGSGPPALLGRVMSMLMLCAFGSFPLSVAVSGVLVRHLGPSLFFPVAGGLVALAILGGLTQREFRTFGATESTRAPDAPAVRAETRTAR